MVVSLVDREMCGRGQKVILNPQSVAIMGLAKLSSNNVLER